MNKKERCEKAIQIAKELCEYIKKVYETEFEEWLMDEVISAKESIEVHADRIELYKQESKSFEETLTTLKIVINSMELVIDACVLASKEIDDCKIVTTKWGEINNLLRI